MVFRAKSLLISPTHFSFVTGHPDHITHAEFRMGGSTNLVFVFSGGSESLSWGLQLACQRTRRCRHYQHSLFRPASSAVSFVFLLRHAPLEKSKNCLAYQRYRYQSTLFSPAAGTFLSFSTFLPQVTQSTRSFQLSPFAGTESNFISSRVSFGRALGFTLSVTHSIDSFAARTKTATMQSGH